MDALVHNHSVSACQQAGGGGGGSGSGLAGSGGGDSGSELAGSGGGSGSGGGVGEHPSRDSDHGDSQVPEADAVKFDCSFSFLHTCNNGSRGRGLRLSSYHNHLKSVHLKVLPADLPARHDELRDALKYTTAHARLETWLRAKQSWLCGECFTVRSWTISCQHSGNVVVMAPGSNAATLICGLPAPSIDMAPTRSLPTPLVARQTDRQRIEPPNSHSARFVLDLNLLDKVFRIKVITVRSIPKECSLQFAQCFRWEMAAVVRDNTIESWVRFLLLPICVLTLFQPQSAYERRSQTRRALQKAQILRALEIWRESPDGIQKLLRRVLDFSFSNPVAPNSSAEVKARRCRIKAMDGQYAAAVKMLTMGGVAPPTAETLEILHAKHPDVALPTLQPIEDISEPALEVEPDAVLEALRSFPKGTACARDALRAQHLLDMLRGPASGVKDEVLSTMTAFINMLLAGKAPATLAPYLASAPLTPLIKPDQSLRPIAVGLIWRRLVSKLACKAVVSMASNYLRDFQFGVGIPCGVEAIIHATQRLVEAEKHNNQIVMCLLDFRNAFNLVDRESIFGEVRRHCPAISKWVEFTYYQPARLYVMDELLLASIGVQQGDPLGPLLFALALHPLIQKIHKECDLKLQAWYLDDGTLVGDTSEVSKAIHIVQQNGPALGLYLNVDKSELYWPSIDPRRYEPHLIPQNIKQSIDGVKLLGGFISHDHAFLQRAIRKRIDKVVETLQQLEMVADPQIQLLLLRSCLGTPKLVYTLRTTPHSIIQDSVLVFDKALRQCLARIISPSEQDFGIQQWDLGKLPIRHGGLGITSATDVSSFAFMASRVQTRELQNHVLRLAGNLPDGSFFNLAEQHLLTWLPLQTWNDLTQNTTAPKIQHELAEVYFEQKSNQFVESTLDVRQRTVLQCVKAPHAQDFLLALPMPGYNQCMNPAAYRAVLRYRLLMPLYDDSDRVCKLCKKPDMDQWGEHALHCRVSPSYTERHDIVRNALFALCQECGISSQREAPVNCLGPSTRGVNVALRPADVLLRGWTDGKSACVDVTGTSPFAHAGYENADTGAAARAAARRKMDKHFDPCDRVGMDFIPFSFDTFGYLAPEAVKILNRVKAAWGQSELVRDTISTSFVFRRIGFAIMRGIALQFVARMRSGDQF